MAVSTAVVNTAAGYTSGIQWTDSAGGTTIEWFTPQLVACTLAGMVVLGVRAYDSAGSSIGTVRLEIARVENDGTGASVWGSSASGAGMFATTEGVFWCYVSGQDLAISDGQRLRFRLLLDDSTKALVTGSTATVLYDIAANAASGDSGGYVPLTLSIYAATAYAPPFTRRDRRIVPLI